MKMSRVQMLRVLVSQRQSTAAEEILELFERTVTESRDVCFSREGDERQLKLLDADLTTAVLSLRGEVQQVIVGEQIPSEPQEQSPTVDPEPSHIKEELEELWMGAQLQGPIHIKSEYDEEKAQSSQLHQRQVDQQIKAEAVERECEGSEPVRKLRMLVKQRLTSLVEEILGLFETTLAEYEELIRGLHKQLEEAVKPEVQVNAADVAQLLTIKQEVPFEQQEWRISLAQGNQQPPPIKENQEQLWNSQEEEQRERLEEGELKIPFTAMPVSSEDAQFPLLHQKLTEQMETGAGGEDGGGSKPAMMFGPISDSQQEHGEKTHSSDYDTENSDDYSQDMSQPQSGLEALNCDESVHQNSCNPVDGHVDSIQDIRTDTGEKPFSCSLCEKGFSEKSDLKRHIRFHSGKKPFSCVFCEKNFTEKADLKRHMRVHTGEKPFSCPICGKSFSEKTDLTRHVRVHTGEKPFSCSTCGKIFSQNENLRRHQRIHSGEKPFSCPVCTKQFTHRGAMVVHMRIHTGEKPFGCSVCGKRYIETGNLKKHMRVHTGEKPFSCTVCGRRFNYQSQVKSHKCSGESSVTIVHHS